MTKKILFAMSMLIAFTIIGLIISMQPKETTATEPTVQIVSSTTYIPHENGQIIARFLDFEYLEINTTCHATILYPNKNLFVDQQMTSSTPLGNYYITFIVPETIGIYEYSVTCDVNGKNISGSKAFTVTSIADAVISFSNQSTIQIIDTINNQTIWINDSQNEQNTLITNISDRNFNISQEIYDYVTTDLVNITISMEENVTGLINTQIGTETNESVKSLLLQIKEKLGFIVINITINATAPEYVFIGEEWDLKAFVYKQTGDLVDNTEVACNTTSNYYSEISMIYQGSDKSFNHEFTPSSSGVIYYEVDCEII